MIEAAPLHMDKAAKLPMDSASDEKVEKVQDVEDSPNGGLQLLVDINHHLPGFDRPLDDSYIVNPFTPCTQWPGRFILFYLPAPFPPNLKSTVGVQDGHLKIEGLVEIASLRLHRILIQVLSSSPSSCLATHYTIGFG
ncbi:hypothetical protein B0H16DRAFT_1453761 [Mycena metata]|uniref:Uncharacterized protein n=1 Tax=Mycena metata TaxID=1033252 RepID=A0AAD7JKD1_9AGAR|nr:hypothetical protein B0H16DRAFT_1453761 [Mycena metata]